ncbi:MAG TPA: DUF4019 domain-containing protein [Ramlibacter sp.]|jgi:hypothetical protein|nr:DUF4019 domain-containing protein [Ramlibacter sp.]
MKMQSLSRRTVLAAAAAALAWPAAFAQAADSDKEAAGALAAQGWLVLLDRKDWGRAWETTGSVFRSKVPLGTWMDAIPKVRDPLGALVERKQVEAAYKTTLQGQPAGEYVTAVFQTKFTNREVAEVLTLVHEPDGKWRVTGYSAQ